MELTDAAGIPRHRSEQAIRFGVQLPNGLPIANWRFWTHGNEVYLAARNFARAWKVSLHSSGKWRIAETRQLKRDTQKDRVIARWQRPAATRGWTESLAVLVPWVAVDAPLGVPIVPGSGDTSWFPAPPNGSRRIFKVMFSAPHIDPENVVTEKADDVVVARFRLPNGETVWLGTREDPLTDFERAKTLEYLAKTRVHVRPRPNAATAAVSASMKAHVIGIVAEDDPILRPPTIFDVVLGRDNLDIQNQVARA